MLEELRKENKSIPKLYNILLSYQITNAKQNEGTIEYETEWTFNGYCADNIDIQIYDLNDTGNLNIAYDYKTSIYKVEDIKNIHRRILNIIKQVVSKEEIKLSEIDIVTPEEKEKLLVEFNKTELKYDENIPFIKYFINLNGNNINCFKTLKRNTQPFLILVISNINAEKNLVKKNTIIIEIIIHDNILYLS